MIGNIAPPSVSLAEISATIPRIIHQTYTTNSLPAPYRENVDRLCQLNPGWEHRLYDDDDVKHFIQSAYGDEMLGIYNSIAPGYGAARADLFRYLVIYRSGGVYLDIKSSASRPFAEIFEPEDAIILTQWDNEPGQEHDGWAKHDHLPHMPREGEFVQWFIAAAPGHPMIQAVIERVVGNLKSYHPLRHGTGLRVLSVTGPIAYTEAILPLLSHHRHRRFRDFSAIGLLYSLVGGGMEHRQVGKSKHYTRSRHPIVDQPRPPLMKLLIRTILEIKAFRRWVLGLG